MWAVSPLPPPPTLRPFFSIMPKPTKPPLYVAVFASSSSSNNNKYKTNQLGGLDVFWAMQKAAAEKDRVSSVTSKSKKNRKRKGLRSAGSHREESDVDYSNVKALCIKSEWDDRLDELETRLQELSEAK